jgi:predicted AAA+ superfamily ATPase
MYKRTLNLAALLNESNYFLFGPRSTGKTSLIAKQLPHASMINLLDADIYEALERKPSSLKDFIQTKIVVIDEVQKLPKILDTVHQLIEKNNLRFLLTGSSARKLKHGGANLLGGRAREASLFPLTFHELGKDFDLLKYLNQGGIPRHYLSNQPFEDLKAYGRTYLAEEIKAEALVRNYDRFTRFLETMATANAKELIYQSISNDSGVPVRTIEGYLEVLKDTLVGYELHPFLKSKKRKAHTRSKFYFFDCGVANYFSKRYPVSDGSSDLGELFEQFIINEVRAYNEYLIRNQTLSFWRTRNCEVDLLVSTKLAIEIKFEKNTSRESMTGLKALRDEGLFKKFMVVGRYAMETEIDGIHFVPYTEFLKKLWTGTYF